VVGDAGDEGIEGGAEPRLVGGQGQHLLERLAGQVVLRLALLHRLLAGHGGHLRVEDLLLQLHVGEEVRLEFVDEGRAVLALRLLDLVEEVLDGAVIGFEDAGDVHGAVLHGWWVGNAGLGTPCRYPASGGLNRRFDTAQAG
jgi:hypothetical protein